MAAPYFHRAYTARDVMRAPFSDYSAGVGHRDGGYCLDAVAPATGGHRARDFVYTGRSA
jgi:hypothetical protein